MLFGKIFKSSVLFTALLAAGGNANAFSWPLINSSFKIETPQAVSVNDGSQATFPGDIPNHRDENSFRCKGHRVFLRALCLPESPWF